MTTLEAPVKPEEVQSQARDAYRRSVAEGVPLNRQQLAERFGRSESWARDRIAEARRADGDEVPRRPVTRSATRRTDTPAARTGTKAAAVTITPTGTSTGAGDSDTPPALTGSDTAGDMSVPPAGVVVPTAAGVTGDMSPPTAVMSPATAAPRTRDMSSRLSPPPADDMTAGSDSDLAGVSHPGARLFAWFGFAFGSLVSVAANVLAAWLPAGDMPDNWAPSVASQVGAAVWPVALLVSVEVISRVAWPKSWLWALVRFGGVAAVGLGSALISYGHIHDVLLSWGYDPLGAGVGPLVVDGLMVVSGFALLAMSSTNDRKA